jgi:hypothetical protein
MYPRVNITRTPNTVTITISPASVRIVNEVGPFSPLPQLKFAMTPWGQGSVAEARVVDIETGSLSTYPQGRAGFNTLYCPVMTEGQGDITGTQPPVNPAWCAFPALYNTDPNQTVPITPADATGRGLPQDVVRPTQSLLSPRPKMRGWVEVDVYGAAAWVAAMADEYDLWIEKFVEPISPGNDPTQYRGVVVLNWERLAAFTFDVNRIGASGDAAWICYRQWRQLSTGGTGTLASPWNTVTGGTETEQQSRERFRTLVADFMSEVVDLIKAKMPLCHLVWFNAPVFQNWYQLDPTDTVVWNASPIATIDGTPMKRYEAIRYEALGWMATDLYPLFDSISVQAYDFLPPGSTSGALSRYFLAGGSESWSGSRPVNDVNVTHNTFTEKTRLSTFYFSLIDDVANTVNLPVVAWLSPVGYFSQTTGYRLSAADQRVYLDIIEGYGSGWSVGFWIDCLDYGWTNATLGNLTSEQRWNEVQQGLRILNPIVATLTGDPGNGGIVVDFPASAEAQLPQILGPTYSGLGGS